MATVLVSIGERDPEVDGEPTGPLRLVREGGFEPRAAYLFAHTDVLDQAQRTRESLSKHCRADVLELRGDAVDVSGLMHTIARLLPTVAEGEDVHVCASSGTPQIGLALTLAVHFRYPHARHWQALDPKRASQPYLRRFDPDAVRHLADVQRALDALERMDFAAAHALFSDRAASDLPAAQGRRRQLEAGRCLAGALTAAGNLDLALAARWLHQAPVSAVGGGRGRFETLQAWYDSLRPRVPRNQRWPVELLAIAQRRNMAGDLTGAMLAVAMAYEVGLAVRLRSLGVDTRQVRGARAGLL